MMRIGLCHYKVGGTDGVSLEMDKWKVVLERMGHSVRLCGGDLGTGTGYLIPELYHHRTEAERMAWNTFHSLRDYPNGAALEREILSEAGVIEEKLRGFITEESIDLLIPNNIWSIGANPAAAVAFARVVNDLQIPAVGHHHDFWWESFRGMQPTCPAAARIVDEYLPPTGPTIGHVVINSFARDELRTRRGALAKIVPNVFDFSGPDWRVDDYNRDFRAEIGVGESDILVLQATRIVPRKGIELAIDLVAALDRGENRRRLEERGLYDERPFGKGDRIVLVLAGYSEDPTKDYLKRLEKRAARAGVELCVISDRIRSRRGRTDNGKKIYSLWDSYVFADLITYPSLYEGWGNQFLEGLHARVPIVVFEYPVYKADIKDKGFAVISLGDELAGKDDLGLVKVPPAVISRAAAAAVTVLTDPAVREEMVARNYELGRRYYSLESLERHLKGILADVSE
jgi:glycosyltransferase involved in cell wall biosynthesis